MKKMIHALSIVLIVAMLSVTVFADSYVPSIEQKSAMRVYSVSATLADGTKQELKTADIVVTALADGEKLAKVDQELLDKAYDSVLDAGSLEKAAPKLAQMLKDAKLNVDDFVVRDLIYVQFLNEALKQDGVKVTVRFDLKVEKDAQVLAMRYVPAEKDTYEWAPIALEDVTVNKDGTVDVVLDGEGPVAFLVKRAK